VNKWELAARLSGVGFFIGLSIVMGLVSGRWLDGIFRTRIIWLFGLLLGIAVAFWGVFRMLVPLLNGNNGNNHKGRSN
jgi:hypothetical protein